MLTLTWTAHPSKPGVDKAEVRLANLGQPSYGRLTDAMVYVLRAMADEVTAYQVTALEPTGAIPHQPVRCSSEADVVALIDRHRACRVEELRRMTSASSYASLRRTLQQAGVLL